MRQSELCTRKYTEIDLENTEDRPGYSLFSEYHGRMFRSPELLSLWGANVLPGTFSPSPKKIRLSLYGVHYAYMYTVKPVFKTT